MDVGDGSWYSEMTAKDLILYLLSVCLIVVLLVLLLLFICIWAEMEARPFILEVDTIWLDSQGSQVNLQQLAHVRGKTLWAGSYGTFQANMKRRRRKIEVEGHAYTNAHTGINTVIHSQTGYVFV